MITIEPQTRITDNTTLVFRLIGLKDGYFQTMGFRTTSPRQLEQELRAMPYQMYGVSTDNSVAVFAPKGRA